MNYTRVILFSASILIAAIIGWIRFKKIDPAFYPFVICLWIATVNEIISYIISRRGLDTSLNNNIYVLLEACFITVQFKSWGLFRHNLSIFYILTGLFAVVWILENFILGNLHTVQSYFRIFYSFCIVLMSIHLNNKLLFSCRGKLISSPAFLICTGFIIYFTYKILFEAFWLYGLNATRNFRINVYLLLTWINLIVNLIYAFALLWIPRKPARIMLY